MAAHHYYSEQAVQGVPQYHPSNSYPSYSDQWNNSYKQPAVSVMQTRQSIDHTASIMINNARQLTASQSSAPVQQTMTFCQHLESLPMFPLNTMQEVQAKQAYTEKYNGAKAAYISSSAFSAKEKMFDKGMNIVTLGGGSLLAARHYLNAITQNEAMCAKAVLSESATAVLTRWAFIAPNESSTVLVDIFECRWNKMNCTPFFVKHSASEPVSLALLGKTGIKIKAGKQYSKNSTNFKHVEEAGIHIGNEVIPMTIVRREQRPISAVEGKEMRERFDREWQVPKI